MTDCDNEAGYCETFSISLNCYINYNYTQLIKTLLRNCSNTNTSLYIIHVYKNYISVGHRNLLIDIELPPHILRLYIHNYQDEDTIRITTFTYNTGLTYMYSTHHTELESNDFFDYFAFLIELQMYFLISNEPPSFANLRSLNYLNIRLVGPVNHVIDNTTLNGLSNLISLSFSNSYFHSISRGAFENLNRLTHLNIGHNLFTLLESDVFMGLSKLKQLYLNNNKIRLASENAFDGLTELTLLELNGNPGFPLNALLSAKYLEYLNLQYNGYQTLDPFIFQQINDLKDLYLNDPFICDCNLQWTSLVSQHGLIIRNALCSEPFNFIDKSITSKQLYENCTQTRTYQCFDMSVTCPNNQVCHNIQDGYICGCQIGYYQRNSGECVDEDECIMENNCEHSCENTQGSYHCVCNEGYQIANNGKDCDDVNECQEGNSGCEFGCMNTIGSYKCYCEYGHQLYNKTHCENEFQCAGLNITTVTNLICELNNSTETMSTQPTNIWQILALFVSVVLILILGCQTVFCALVTRWYLKIKASNLSLPVTNKYGQSKGTIQVNMPSVTTNMMYPSASLYPTI